MPRPGIRLAFLVLAAHLALAAAHASPTAKPPAPGTLFMYPERIPLEAGKSATAERGLLFVPANRSRPESGVFAVEFYRFPAAPGVPADRPPVFRLFGGPGWPGLSGSLEAPEFYQENIVPQTAIAELVIVGQRGIGSSKPDTHCDGIAPLPLDVETTAEQAAKIMDETSKRCREFWERQGVDLTGLTVVEAAADVDDLRRALGYEKIALTGGSFGSHWGMTVMRNYPQTIVRALLTGMEGPDHTYDHPAWVLAALRRMAAAAEADPKLAEHVPEGGLIRALETVIERVENEPVTVTVPHPETEAPTTVRFDARTVRSLALGTTRRVSSRRGMPTWPRDVLAMYDGDWRGAAESLIRRNDDPDFPTASFFMLDCGSGITPERDAEHLADPAVDVVGHLGWFYRGACPAWGSDLGDDFRQSFETEIPTVIVHGNWDASTPFENALELAPYFKTGKLIVVEGGSHGALSEALEASERFRDALFAFMATGDLSDLPETVTLPPIEWVVPEEDAGDDSAEDSDT